MLKLTHAKLGENPAGQALLTFEVRHNVGCLRTSLSQNLQVHLDHVTGAVQAELHLTDLEASGLDEARLKMALWCDRMAAALRYTERTAADLPTYDRFSFEKEKLPKWLQAEFDRLVEQLRTAEDPSELVDQLLQDGHPLAYIPDALDIARTLAE